MRRIGLRIEVQSSTNGRVPARDYPLLPPSGLLRFSGAAKSSDYVHPVRYCVAGRVTTLEAPLRSCMVLCRKSEAAAVRPDHGGRWPPIQTPKQPLAPPTAECLGQAEPVGKNQECERRAVRRVRLRL